MSYASEALKLALQLKFDNGAANSYGIIGNIHSKQGDYSKALENHEASLKIKLKINDKKGIASSYNNIGNIYHQQADYAKALEYHFSSLKNKR